MLEQPTQILWLFVKAQVFTKKNDTSIETSNLLTIHFEIKA